MLRAHQIFCMPQPGNELVCRQVLELGITHSDLTFSAELTMHRRSKPIKPNVHVLRLRVPAQKWERSTQR